MGQEAILSALWEKHTSTDDENVKRVVRHGDSTARTEDGSWG